MPCPVSRWGCARPCRPCSSCRPPIDTLGPDWPIQSCPLTLMDALPSHWPLQNLPTGLVHPEEVRRQHQVYGDKNTLHGTHDRDRRAVPVPVPPAPVRQIPAPCHQQARVRQAGSLAARRLEKAQSGERLFRYPVGTLDLLRDASAESEGLETRLRNLADGSICDTRIRPAAHREIPRDGLAPAAVRNCRRVTAKT